MTTDEVIEKITGEYKWYHTGGMASSTAYNTLRRYKEGRITLNKLAEFLGRFGYQKVEDGKWEKK